MWPMSGLNRDFAIQILNAATGLPVHPLAVCPEDSYRFVNHVR